MNPPAAPRFSSVQRSRIDRVSGAALALPAEQRAAYVAAECADDEAVRAEVLELFAEVERGADTSFMSAPAALPPLDAPARRAVTSIDAIAAAAGAGATQIGPYRLVQLIGEGGFGTVFRAEQESPVRREVALKIIKLGMDTRQVIARFEAERQALAMMDHPHIARVFDAGATDTGRPYFVMELVKGVHIIEYCDRNNLSIRDRLELFAQVCQAVQHAHQKGVIHRDLKPGNILITHVDDQPVPKVIDFGIAKATQARLTEETCFTEVGQFIGTPAYMAPEQADTIGDDIDTRCDIYSLGVLLYELVTGATPFDIGTLRKAGLEELKRIIREAQPSKPSTRLSRLGAELETVARRRALEPRKLSAVLRGDLDWIVMKALEKDRNRRYETANGLALDIHRFLAGQAVLAAPPSATYLFQKFVRRHRVSVIAGTVVAAVLVLGVIGTTGGMLWALDEKSRAERTAYQAQIFGAAHAVDDQRMDAAAASLAATAPRLRGWEFQHLASRLDRSLPSPFPASWKITRVNWAAASGTTAILRTDAGGGSAAPPGWVVLSPDLRTERFVLPDTEGGNLWLAPDGSRAVWTPPSASDPRPIRFWDLATGESDSTRSVTTIPWDASPLQAPAVRDGWGVTWSPTGDRFIIAREDGFQLHENGTGTLLDRRPAEGLVAFTQHPGPPDLVSLRGRFAAERSTASAPAFDARAIRLLDADTFEPWPGARADFRFDSPLRGSCYWQSRVACSTQDGTLHILEIKEGALHPLLKLAVGMGVLTTPAWSPDGRMVAVGTREGSVVVWDITSTTPATPIAAFRATDSAEFTGLLFLPDSGNLWTCDAQGRHCVWLIRSGSVGVLAHRSFVYPVVVSRDGGMLLSGGWDGHSGHAGGLKLWDARTGALVAEYGRPNEIVTAAALSPDGRYAVAGYWSNVSTLRRTEVIDLWSGRVALTFRPAAGEFRGVVHPDGRRAIGAFPPGATYVWELLSGKVLWQSDERASAVAVSPDGRLLALAERDGEIRLLDAGSYADIRRWDAHARNISSLSFSPNGKRLLSTSRDDTVGVWNAASGALVARLVGQQAGVTCAAMSPDGTRIATGSRDGYVRLWDAGRFENVAQLGGHKDYIFSIAWSPDGRQLFTGSGDATVRIWDTRTLAEQVDAARERSDAMPAIEARVAKAWFMAESPPAALEAVLAAPQTGPRERELVRQTVARFACRGMPAYYRAPRAATPIAIDGRIDDGAWNDAPWSEPFLDIEGDAKPKPRFETRVRMCWDETYLYVAAKLEEPHISAPLKNDDDHVRHVNDFGIFLDPDGDARRYGEVEVNALGTIFTSRIDRPDAEGGNAHHEWLPSDLRAAVSVEGTLNDPANVDRGWTVEVAIPHSALADHATVPRPPRPGDVWRINFSRVERQYDVVDGRYIRRAGTRDENWAWSPQHQANMHVPEHWGFVEFVAGTASTQFQPGRVQESGSSGTSGMR